MFYRRHDFDWTGKRVAIIGNGAAAIQVSHPGSITLKDTKEDTQILPNVQKTAAKVVTYIRNLTYISPGFGGPMGNPETYGGNFTYTEERKREFRENPEAFSKYLRELETL